MSQGHLIIWLGTKELNWQYSIGIVVGWWSSTRIITQVQQIDAIDNWIGSDLVTLGKPEYLDSVIVAIKLLTTWRGCLSVKSWKSSRLSSWDHSVTNWVDTLKSQLTNPRVDAQSNDRAGLIVAYWEHTKLRSEASRATKY